MNWGGGGGLNSSLSRYGLVLGFLKHTNQHSSGELLDQQSKKILLSPRSQLLTWSHNKCENSVFRA